MVVDVELLEELKGFRVVFAVGLKLSSELRSSPNAPALRSSRTIYDTMKVLSRNHRQLLDERT